MENTTLFHLHLYVKYVPHYNHSHKTPKCSVKLHGDLQRIYPNQAKRRQLGNNSFTLLSELWNISNKPTFTKSTFARELLLKNAYTEFLENPTYN